jgi:hypothetical protein
LRYTTLSYVGIVFIEKLSELVYEVIQTYFSGNPGGFYNLFCERPAESHVAEYGRGLSRILFGKGKRERRGIGPRI